MPSEVDGRHPVSRTTSAEKAALLNEATIRARITEYTDSLSNLHIKAWGKQWPYKSTCKILKNEMIQRETDPVNEDDLVFKDSALRDILHIPDEYTYDCFREMDAFTQAFAAAAVVKDVLVVRKEYEILQKALEEKGKKQDEEYKKKKKGHKDQLSVVVTGQPGIGSYEILVHV